MRKEIRVIAILPIEGATIGKYNNGYSKGYETNVTYVLEDERQITKRTRANKLKDLKASIAKLPQHNVNGLLVTLDEHGRIESTVYELFASNAAVI